MNSYPPVYALAPLEYRYALDAALTLVPDRRRVRVQCNLAALQADVAARIADTTQSATAVLWIEPLQQTWKQEMQQLAAELPLGGTLLMLASHPLAGLLPERADWREQPLGIQPAGIRQLRQAFRQLGLRMQARYGVHSLSSISWNMLSHAAQRIARPDLADRLRATAQQHYLSSGMLAGLATVGLVCAQKERR
jgi:hypothetical protein